MKLKVLTRNVALFLGTYAFVDDVAANIRQKDDHVNEFAGGCAAGFLTGLRSGCRIRTATRTVPLT